MKLPRFQIASIMLVVVLAALDFAVIRALLGFRFLVGGLLILGALPMTNVLAVSLLIGRWRPRKRPFLWGFVPFGAMALALYVAVATFFPYRILTCMVQVGHPLAVFLGDVVILGLPQVVFALIGGLSSCKFMARQRLG